MFPKGGMRREWDRELRAKMEGIFRDKNREDNNYFRVLAVEESDVGKSLKNAHFCFCPEEEGLVTFTPKP